MNNNNFYNDLVKYLAETPREQVLAEWEKTKHLDGEKLNQMEAKLDQVLSHETSEDLTIWLRNKRHQEITKELAVDFAKWLAIQWLPIWVEDKFMWEWDVEMPIKDIPEGYLGYKTEQELYELYKKRATNQHE